MRCPTCRSDFDGVTSNAKPFCSERCRLIDLGHWLDESFSVPNVPNPEADEIPDDNWARDSLIEPEELADAEEPTDA